MTSVKIKIDLSFIELPAYVPSSCHTNFMSTEHKMHVITPLMDDTLKKEIHITRDIQLLYSISIQSHQTIEINLINVTQRTCSSNVQVGIQEFFETHFQFNQKEVQILIHDYKYLTRSKEKSRFLSFFFSFQNVHRSK